jgi:hypothetical protein
MSLLIIRKLYTQKERLDESELLISEFRLSLFKKSTLRSFERSSLGRKSLKFGSRGIGSDYCEITRLHEDVMQLRIYLTVYYLT